MTGDEGYILAKVLTGLFRNRPSCAVTIFVSIIVIVLGGMLFQAETPDDRLFPIIGLSFISVMALGYAVRAVRQRTVEDAQPIADTPIAHEPLPLTSENRPLEAVPREAVPKKPSVDLRLPLVAAVSAAVVVPPIICVSVISIPLRPPVSHDVVELVGDIAGFVICAASPLAAFIAAIGSLAVTRLAGHRDSRPWLIGAALLTGGAIGLLVGVVAARIIPHLICGSETLCSP